MSDDPVLKIECTGVSTDGVRFHVDVVGSREVVVLQTHVRGERASVYLSSEDQMRLATWLLERRMGR